MFSFLSFVSFYFYFISIFIVLFSVLSCKFDMITNIFLFLIFRFKKKKKNWAAQSQRRSIAPKEAIDRGSSPFHTPPRPSHSRSIADSCAIDRKEILATDHHPADRSRNLVRSIARADWGHPIDSRSIARIGPIDRQGAHMSETVRFTCLQGF